MSYRDDLAAARARIEELEQELREERGKIVQLERRLKAEQQRSAVPVKRHVRAADDALGPASESRRFGARQLHFQRPWSYWPLWHGLWAAIRAAVTYRLPTPQTESLIYWLAFRLLFKPAYYLVMLPLYFLIVIPWFAGIAFATTPVAALVKVVRGLKLTDRLPPPEQRPEGLDAAGAMAMPVIVFVFTAPFFAPMFCTAATGCG